MVTRIFVSVLHFLVLATCAITAHVPTVMISPGVIMPMMAFGTAKTSLTSCTVQKGVEQWLNMGGRHIDTADDYGTQPDVGRALRSSNVSRSEIFLTTKVPGPIGKQAVIDKILHTALPELGVEYIDLVLIHFPCKDGSTACPDQAAERQDTWAGLVELRQQKTIRAIGVSNYDVEQVAEVLTVFKEAPAVNQVQYHLASHNETLLQHMKSMGTTLEAWASLGGPTVHGKRPTIPLDDPRLKGVAAKYNMSTAQVVFRWETQKGVVPVTATCSEQHTVADLKSFRYQLSDADIGKLDAMMPLDFVMV